jgi:hypothetical protein
MDLVSRIHSTKLRTAVHHRSFVLGRFAALRRTLALYEEDAEAGGEVLEYFPIAAVAATEAYFRFTLAELVNVGHRFLEAVDDLMKEKDVRIDADVLKALHGQRVTIGEVIAYSLSYSTKENIGRYMSRLLGKDFFSELRRIWPEFVERRESRVVDFDEMMRDLERTYQLRHVFCHEAPTEVRLTVEEASRCLEASISFINVSEYVISSALMWDVPPTSGSEAFELARDAYEAAVGRTEQSASSLEQVLPAEKKTLFTEGQAGWLQYRDNHADLWALLVAEGGSMKGTVHYEYLRELTDTRIEQLEEMISFAAERYGRDQLGTSVNGG